MKNRKLSLINLLGRHSCLWCLASSKDMNDATGNDSPPRTLTNLQEHYASFQESGAKLKSAKDHFNVINDIFFDIPIDQVYI